LVQLKKISSADVCAVLSSQPQITYSLFQLMVQLDIVDLEALNKTLQPTGSALAAPVQSSSPLVAPAPVVPNQHAGQLLQSREPATADLRGIMGQSQPEHDSTVAPQGLQYPPAHGGMQPNISPELLNNIPEDQKVSFIANCAGE